MSYNLDPISDGCYPGTNILINKLNIHDESELLKVEALTTYMKISNLEINPIEGDFDFIHYKNIHKYLFEDIYAWAGDTRAVNISKKRTFFCPAEKIEDRAYSIFNRLKKCNYFVGLNHSDFVLEIVDFYCETNELHPFREGNGRAQRTFLTQLIKFAGYNINFSEIDTDLLMIATIQASSGVDDLLKNIFTKYIRRS